LPTLGGTPAFILENNNLSTLSLSSQSRSFKSTFSEYGLFTPLYDPSLLLSGLPPIIDEPNDPYVAFTLLFNFKFCINPPNSLFFYFFSIAIFFLISSFIYSKASRKNYSTSDL
jgi:hypothetical protein